MNWKNYWKWISKSIIGMSLLITGATWIVDPYGNLPLSPPFERTAMASNQRYSYPAIARNKTFNSAVFGTSTTRMLQPKTLDAVLGGRFANLSMNSARAYEQARLFDVFSRSHPTPQTIIIGLDIVWCNISATLTKYTFRRFPEWMYDANTWNDIPPMVEFKTLEVVGRQAAYLMGLKKAKYGPDGYASLFPPLEEYDLNKVKRNIYGRLSPKVKSAVKAIKISRLTRASWTYPSHELLIAMLAKLPRQTRKILVFVPYHSYKLPKLGSLSAAQWEECKKRISLLVNSIENVSLLDFMIDSPFTRRDENYWDPLHFTQKASDLLVGLIKRGSENKVAPNGEYVALN